MLEERRIGLVAIEVASELVLHPRNPRRIAIEKLHGRRMLRTRPCRNLRLLAVLEPSISIRQRHAVDDIDDGPCRRLWWKERRRPVCLSRSEQHNDHEMRKE